MADVLGFCVRWAWLTSFAFLVVGWRVTFPLAVNTTKLCSTEPGNYAAAMVEYPNVAFALQELEKHAIAAWYSDNRINGDYVELAHTIVDKCTNNSMMTIVVYGLPNKDCEQNYSNDGRNKSPEDYAKFVQTLAEIVGSRKVLYVLEPDAVGLLANGGCAVQSGYKENLQTAIKILSSNVNAAIYLDVGFWSLTTDESAGTIAKLMKELSESGHIKGITLNTSNYRSNDELAKLCGTFQNATGTDWMHCIIDSSRNFNGASESNEWCNAKTGGIGRPPTSHTGYDNIDYLVWIKPPGDSDGFCNGTNLTSDALEGPMAGKFFKEHLKLLWNQGYFVKELGMPEIDPPPKTEPPKNSPKTSPIKQSESKSKVALVVVLVVGIAGVALVGASLAWWWRRRRSRLYGNDPPESDSMVDGIELVDQGTRLRAWSFSSGIYLGSELD